MAKRLTPEEKAAREVQKKLDRETARLAKIAERQAQWAAERQAARDAFEAGLSEEDRLAISTILKPNGTKVNPYDGNTVPTYESEFIESLTNQLNSRGCLSPAQLVPVVKAYRNKLEFEAQKAKWPDIAEGAEVAVLCKVTAIDARPNTGFGPSFKIKLKSHYGRLFHVNTNAQRFLSVAREALNSQLPVNVQGRAGWVSPDTRIVVLDKKGLYFQGL